MFYLGLLLLSLQLLFKGDILLLQGLHQQQQIWVVLLLQGQEVCIQLTNLKNTIQGIIV